VGRLAETRSDGGGQREAQRVAGPAVEHRVGERDRGLLPGKEVADVHRIEPRLEHLHHDRGIARGDRILVTFLRRLLLDHHSFEDTPVHLDLEFEEHRIEGEGEGVHRLDVHRLVVAVGLGHGDFCEKVTQNGGDGDIAEGYALALGSDHRGRKVVHRVSFSSRSCS
jgi:hypothetical protein